MASNDMQELAQKKQVWNSCDPVTLVAAARDELYENGGSNQAPATGPIEEVISRFEHLTRATIGASQFKVTQSSRS